MKRHPVWGNPKPSLFKKTPPEIAALEQRKSIEGERQAQRRDRFFKDSINLVNGAALLGVISAVAATFVLFGR